MVPGLDGQKGLWTSDENAYHPKRYGFSGYLIFMSFWGRDDYETQGIEFVCEAFFVKSIVWSMGYRQTKAIWLLWRIGVGDGPEWFSDGAFRGIFGGATSGASQAVS
ncbi:MAG: hypothetical protein NPIRA03_18220 [Nitrospirales bacterium]|nr:MAG: hypothetical protein NPIRA03_18220 [Nitrospirales bacterium]